MELFLICKDVYDRIHSFSLKCGAYKYFRIRIQAVNICCKTVHIEVCERKKIDLVDHNIVGCLEQFRIF